MLEGVFAHAHTNASTCAHTYTPGPYHCHKEVEEGFAHATSTCALSTAGLLCMNSQKKKKSAHKAIESSHDCYSQ